MMRIEDVRALCRDDAIVVTKHLADRMQDAAKNIRR